MKIAWSRDGVKDESRACVGFVSIGEVWMAVTPADIGGERLYKWLVSLFNRDLLSGYALSREEGERRSEIALGVWRKKVIEELSVVDSPREMLAAARPSRVLVPEPE